MAKKIEKPKQLRYPAISFIACLWELQAGKTLRTWVHKGTVGLDNDGHVVIPHELVDKGRFPFDRFIAGDPETGRAVTSWDLSGVGLTHLYLPPTVGFGPVAATHIQTCHDWARILDATHMITRTMLEAERLILYPAAEGDVDAGLPD